MDTLFQIPLFMPNLENQQLMHLPGETNNSAADAMVVLQHRSNTSNTTA
jgi:hypothetical protein